MTNLLPHCSNVLVGYVAQTLQNAVGRVSEHYFLMIRHVCAVAFLESPSNIADRVKTVYPSHSVYIF